MEGHRVRVGMFSESICPKWARNFTVPTNQEQAFKKVQKVGMDSNEPSLRLSITMLLSKCSMLDLHISALHATPFTMT